MRFQLLCISVCLASFTSAQVHIGYDQNPELKKATELTPERLAMLRGTTTLFFYSPEEEPYLERMRAALDTLWTITELEFHPMKDEARLVGEGSRAGTHSFWTTKFESIASASPNTMPSVRASLVLWMTDRTGKRAYGVQYAGIQLDPTRKSLDELNRGGYPSITGSASINNWSPGLIVKYLGYANDLLLAREHRGYTSDVESLTALKKLKKDTLYVLESTLEMFSKWNNQGTANADARDILEDYPYPWKVVTNAQLSEMLLKGKRRIFYLISTKYSGARFITVFESSKGTMAYSTFENMKYNVKPSDFADLAKAIAGGN